MRATKNITEAQQRLGVANHLLTRTYPLVQDSRMLLAVTKELHAANAAAITALLENELANKRIPAILSNPESRMDLLTDSLKQHSLSQDYMKNAQMFHDIVVLHEKSPVEFATPDKFVICDKDYKLTSVTLENLKSALSTTRSFIDSINKIVSENGVAV